MSANYMHYNWDDVGKLMSYVVMECPLDCKEKFRTKAVLRDHLKKHHSPLEYEKFLENEKRLEGS